MFHRTLFILLAAFLGFFLNPTLKAEPVLGKVRLLFYDRNGRELNARQARDVINHGKLGWNTDARVDPATLQVLEKGKAPALFDDGSGHLAFSLLPDPTGVELNWPTTRGYSMVVLDKDGEGFSGPVTVNFTYQAARSALIRLKRALKARPLYKASPRFQAAYQSATGHLQTAQASGDPGTQGREGQLALDALDEASGDLLEEYGPAYSKAHLADRKPWLGLTLDSQENYEANLQLAARITQPYGWVRIVFDPGVPPGDYKDMVEYAQSLGLKVLGQPVDSEWAKNLSREAYLQRFKDYIQAFPRMDAWEVANECNGEWLPPRIREELADTAAIVKARTKALSVLTLHWQMGGDHPESSVFNWERANLSASTRGNLDVVLLSCYIEGSPLGLVFDQVMEQLQRDFPNQRIGLGEMGYWGDDSGSSKAWWAMEEKDPKVTARRAILDHYYRSALGYPSSVGGVFWWFFIKDMKADPQLSEIVKRIADNLK